MYLYNNSVDHFDNFDPGPKPGESPTPEIDVPPSPDPSIPVIQIT